MLAALTVHVCLWCRLDVGNANGHSEVLSIIHKLRHHLNLIIRSDG